MAFPNYVDATERRIANALLKRGLGHGWTVSVYDGEKWTLNSCDKLDTITSALATTDCDWVQFRNRDGDKLGKVLLIWGNREDLISDCSDNDAMDALTKGL